MFYWKTKALNIDGMETLPEGWTMSRDQNIMLFENKLFYYCQRIDAYQEVPITEKILEFACGETLALLLTQEKAAMMLNVEQLVNSDVLEIRRFELRNCQKIVAGKNHFFVQVKNEQGKIVWFGIGENSHGQLGLDIDVSGRVKEITEIPLLEGVVHLATGHVHTLGIKEDSKDIVLMGSNKQGQLGMEKDGLDIYTPFTQNFKKKIKKIACAGASSYAIDEDNKLLVCGSNIDHELGLPQRQYFSDWTYLKLSAPVENVYTSLNYSVIITCKNNTSYGLGCNNDTSCACRARRIV